MLMRTERKGNRFGFLKRGVAVLAGGDSWQEEIRYWPFDAETGLYATGALVIGKFTPAWK